MKRSKALFLQCLVLIARRRVDRLQQGLGRRSAGRVNRTKITAADFKRQLEDLQPQMQQAVASDPKARKEFLEDLIGIEVVLQEAKRQGLDKDPEFKKRQEMLKKEMERGSRTTPGTSCSTACSRRSLPTS